MKNLYHEKMSSQEQKVVDGIYAVVNQYCKEKGIKVAYDDRAEQFIEAIAEYLEASKED